jgi:hypothetical protein
MPGFQFQQIRKSGAADVSVLGWRRWPLLPPEMATQKFRPTRFGGFSGAKAYIRYVEVLKKRRNAVNRTFCDAISVGGAI